MLENSAVCPLSESPAADALPSASTRDIMVASFAAGLLHLLVVLAGAWLASKPQLEASTLVEEAFDVHWLVAVEALENGGGSLAPGTSPEAAGVAISRPQREPAHVARALPTAPPRPALPAHRSEPPPDEVALSEPGETAEAEDWLAQDALFAQTSSEDLFALPARPRAAWTSLVRPSKPSSGQPPSGDSRLSQVQGLGPGEGGGLGSGGRSGSGLLVEEPFAFGGPEGAFRAYVCFVPHTTRLVRSIGACKTEAEFRTNSINVSAQSFDSGFPGVTDRFEWFAIFYAGPFQVAEAGTYTFRVISDDGSALFINGQLIVDNDGVHGPREAKGQVQLQAGEHAFELHYFQGPRLTVALQLFVTPPGERERLFSPGF